MEWVERLHDRVIGLDTAPLIYFIEDHPSFAGHLALFWQPTGFEYRMPSSLPQP